MMRSLVASVCLIVLFAVPLQLSAAQEDKKALPENAPAAVYPFRYSGFDYKVAWKASSLPAGIWISGTMKNSRNLSVTAVELTLFLKGADGKYRSRITVLPTPQFTVTNEPAEFSLLLKNEQLKPGDVFEFVIHYRAEGGSGRAVDWRTTFAADANSGMVMDEAVKKPDP